MTCRNLLKRHWPLFLLGAVHAFFILWLFSSSIYQNGHMMNDINLFFKYASKVLDGSLPYRDFTIEYPPLALLFFTLPRLAAASAEAYRFAFAVEVLLFDLLGLVLSYALAQRLNINRRVTISIYTILLLAAGPIIIYRFDIFPAVLVLASLYFFSKQKYATSWAILAVAALTKLYPAVIAPIYLIYQLKNRKYRETIYGIVGFAVTTAAIIIPALLISPGGFLNSFTMQMNRGLHVEYTWSSFLLLAQNLGLTHASIRPTGPTPLSINLTSPTADMLARISPLIILSVLLLIYVLFFLRIRREQAADQSGISPVVNFSFLAVLGFLLSGNIFSPQFIIWLFPLAPLVTGRWRHFPWVFVLAACMLTYYLYPTHYNSFTGGDRGMVYVLLSRNLALMAAAVFLAIPGKADTAKAFFSRFHFRKWMAYATLVLLAVIIFGLQLLFNINADAGGRGPGGMPGGRDPGGQPGFQNSGPQSGGPPPGR